MTVTHDDFESYLHGRLTEQRDALHDSEACSLLDEQVEQLEAALPGGETFDDYRQVLRTRANYESAGPTGAAISTVFPCSSASPCCNKKRPPDGRPLLVAQ